MWKCIQTLKNISQKAVIFKIEAVKMSATTKNNYFLEKVEAHVEVFSLCGFL
jgi:hypothetical protein